MAIINEFIDALAIEIETLKKGKGGGLVNVYNGELIRRTLELYIYQFTLENFLIAMDDTPANIEVNGKEYECNIISVAGQRVQVSLEQNLGERIATAKIKTNTWYLLERLRKKFEDNLENKSKFEISEKLFKDRNEKIDGGNFDTSYSLNVQGSPNPNPSQHKAIESSINDFISIIWGPPGTGKTATIAKAIESHLNLGRRVLLLSHSNNAVDQALIKVAAQMIASYYNEGFLVRLGTPKKEMLERIESDCPLVLMDKIAEFKSRELIKEKNELNKQFEQIKNERLRFESIISLNLELEKTGSQIHSLESEVQKTDGKINIATDEISSFNIEIEILYAKLEKAQSAGVLKRTFLGLDPKKIETQIASLESELSIKQKHLDNNKEQRRQLEQQISPLNAERRNQEKSLSDQLVKTGKDISQIQNEISELDINLRLIQTRLDEINRQIEEIKIEILKEAKLVATTLTKSYIAKEIETVDFDILIVDEVSMAPMPMLYWAASKIKKGITIVGDFKQLPPICISDDELVKKWLGRSLFDHLKISTISRAAKRVQLLDTQYRMHPHISGIINKRFYANRLKDGENVAQKIKSDTVSGNSALCLIDTSPHNPWCSQFETGGRFNLISALVCVSLAERILSSFNNDESIGIITPYRNQARLIQKIAKDAGILENAKVRINTVHSFQGGEETAVIFDCVEGEGAKKWSMINEYNNIDSADLLLNVALTRAEKKLYVVANLNYIRKTFKSDSLLINIFQHVISNGKKIKSTEIINDLKDENFEFWISKLSSLRNRPDNYEVGYAAYEFWPAFHNDLSRAKNELIIFSAFLTSDRFSKLHLIFSELLSRGINIYIITLPPNEQPPIMKGVKEVIEKLHKMGIRVKFRRAMHEKIALIDRKVKWVGSLNILSHNSRQEYMERIEGENSAKELFDKFDLETLLITENINGELCPVCQQHYIVPKYSYKTRRHFYHCSGYPDCDFTAHIRTRTLEDLTKNKYVGQLKPKAKKTTSKATKSSPVSKIEYKAEVVNNVLSGQQWESPLLFWSAEKLPGYTYSKKKNAWWKKKPQ